MTISTALTIIAICFIILTLIVVGLGIMLFIVTLRVIRLEKTITQEVSVLRRQLGELIQTARESSSRLGQTVQEFKASAYRMGLIATSIAGLIESRKAKTLKASPPKTKVRPWWLSTLALGYSLWNKRRKTKQSPPSSSVSS
ncbi:hypothetical protein [Sulfobacillus thermosulfidooxidans]|uniref:DUF948 domain-containing protein n=1 Tax=Sulfobacillus thermosulfidooxidans TaxID=28034 RepID=A0A1R0IKX3_SULTH|nr:hypothetical protein [Sulfobacillus thermosulfidooxidans]OLZ10899.1 hypothetical protein BFX05_09140 [Sulfobacillus thermosulfidooxidans]OLZ14387.1 hypothetical protein BFX06_08965 [Sulfobacillus thermosulfidooxidans]OLZ19130.1 hypothetical protein BFX07_05360 [Sulfobacillus thermosulfidooxidans]PSR28490.1 MAG: hypothetical protein C7B47_04805 [Sulfobacillus thermosulfidooxidans]